MWALAVLLVGVHGAGAATKFHFNSETTADFVGQGDVGTITSPAAAFVASVTPRNIVSVTIDAPGNRWNLWFRGRFGVVPTPGEHPEAREDEGPIPLWPILYVSGRGRGCSVVRGHFTVHELSFGVDGRVHRFAVDFAQHCNQGGWLYGSLRMGTGDDACTAAPDGSPCDDLDACTAGELCLSGACQGGPAAPCSDDDLCTPIDACDPGTGACRGGGAVPCRDTDVCNGEEFCHPATGMCQAGARLRCDDGDPCNGTEWCDQWLGCRLGAAPHCAEDEDPCTRAACVPSQGCRQQLRDDVACWDVQGTTLARARVGDRRGRARAEFSGQLLLHPDGTYEIPGGTCESSGAPLPAEVGTVRLGRRERMHLDPTNFEENLAAAEACAGGPPLRVKRRSLRQWIRIPQANGRSCAWNDAPRDGAHLCGFTRLRGRTRIGGQAASVLVKQRFTGERRQP